MASPITECHRVLLTFIRARKIVLEDEMDKKFPILAAHFGLDQENPSLLRDHISTLNVALEKFAFKIETIRDQQSRKIQYVFINTRFDDVIQGCTPYTPPELDAIKHVIDEIINASNFKFCFPHGNAKQLVGSILKLKASDSGYFIARLVDDGWIDITDLNRLVLAPASLAELKVYLGDRYGYFLAEDTLGKLLVCHTCGDLVTLGLKCKSHNCGSSFHEKCGEVYMRSNDGCPSSTCSDNLENMVTVGP